MSRHIPRIYVDQPLDPGREIELAGGPAHHLQHVLRIREGDKACLFNGEGGEYLAKVTSVQRHSLRLNVERHEAVSRESPLNILLAQGIARGERMDIAIQKAVELGATAIQPLHTEKSQRLPAERMEKKLQHWQAVARSAAEQSGRMRLPQVHAPQTLGDWLTGAAQAYPQQARLLLAPDAAGGLSGREKNSSACLLIGPESGLSEQEIAQAVEQGFNAVRLGPRTLRTETAALVAISALQLLWGDLG